MQIITTASDGFVVVSFLKTYHIRLGLLMLGLVHEFCSSGKDQQFKLKNPYDNYISFKQNFIYAILETP